MDTTFVSCGLAEVSNVITYAISQSPVRLMTVGWVRERIIHCVQVWGRRWDHCLVKFISHTKKMKGHYSHRHYYQVDG